MKFREIIDKHKYCAPLLSAALVAACVSGSLGRYEAPSYAEAMTAQREDDADRDRGKKDNTKESAENEKNAPTGEQDTASSGRTGSGASGMAGRASGSGGTAYVPQVEEPSGYRDGTYYGTATGFAGNLKVRVDISGGRIVSVEIVETVDDNAYVQRASGVIRQMLAGQTTNVDTVSGATYSSAGIIRAVRNALQQAELQQGGSSQGGGGQSGNSQNGNGQSGNGQSQGGSQSGNGQSQGGSENGDGQEITGTVPYKEGIYYGTAEGYNGDITVAVVIQDETIKAILVTEQEDDAAFFNRAMAVVKSVLKQQNTEVDTVSGATYSSRGLIGAIRDALANAEKATNGEGNGGTNGETDGEGNGGTNGETDSEGNGGTNGETDSEGNGGTNGEADGEGNGGTNGETDSEGNGGTNGETDSEGNGGTNGEINGEGNGGTNGETDSEGNGGANGENNGENDDGDIFHDGTFIGQALCVPDEDEEFEPYILSLRITVKNNRIIEVFDIEGDGASSNDRYINRAANGTKTVKGIVAQILEKGSLEDIDTVSRATCSSKSILEACMQALEHAKEGSEGSNLTENSNLGVMQKDK